MNSNFQKRFRDYGFKPGFLTPGKRNTIADVPGVTVGHSTKNQKEDERTGITVINPGTPDIFNRKLPAAIAVGNGFGKLAGITQVEELGTLEAPIALTNTLAVGAVVRGMVDLMLKNTANIPQYATINVVVGETNDGILNNIHKDALTKEDVFAAYADCSAGFRMGAVGAGTGTRAFSWKGGIGSASRIIKAAGKTYALGILVQTNFGGALTILGVPIGSLFGKTDFTDLIPAANDGSCMLVIATDAPLSARQLKRIAARSFIGLGRAGSVLAHSSGDYAIAFSTNRAGVEGVREGEVLLPDENLTPFFLAAVEAAEESVYDALFLAETVKGRDGNVLEAIQVDRVVEILKQKTL